MTSNFQIYFFKTKRNIEKKWVNHKKAVGQFWCHDSMYQVLSILLITSCLNLHHE